MDLRWSTVMTEYSRMSYLDVSKVNADFFYIENQDFLQLMLSNKTSDYCALTHSLYKKGY